MNKKGVELTINTVVVVILALLVLVILFFVLKTFIFKGTAGYINLTLEAEKDIKAKNICEKMFYSRRCMSACTADYIDHGTDWDDCKAMVDKPHCCELSK
jgi:hypothetical protein